MKNSFIVYVTYNMVSKTCNFFYKTFLTKKEEKSLQLSFFVTEAHKLCQQKES